MEGKVTYPEVRKTLTDTRLELFTFIRKRGSDNKWYLIPLRQETTNLDHSKVVDFTNQFHAVAYRHTILFKIEKDKLNESPFYVKLDENQDTEKKRLEDITL